MNIMKLSKFVRYELRCNNTVVIYKNGRSWGYELFSQLDKRSVTVTERYRNINKVSPLNFIIDNYNKKFWDYSSIEAMKKSIQAMENAVKSTKDVDSTGISNKLKSNLRLINHYIDTTMNKNDTIKNGLIKHRYVSDCCTFFEVPKEYSKYIKQSKNHPMEKIDFSEFLLNHSDGIIKTYKKGDLEFIDNGTKLDSNGTHYIDVDGEQINYKNLYLKMLNLYDSFDYELQLHQIRDNIGIVVLIDNNVVALILPIVSLKRPEEKPVKKETEKENKKTMDNIKDDFMNKTLNANRVTENTSKKEFMNDVLNGKDIKESITLRIAQKLRDNNLHGKTFYIPLETETDNYNRFLIVNNELRHNDRNVLIDSSRLTYKDYADIEDIINNFVQIENLEKSIKDTREQIITKLLQENNITDKKEIFKFRVNLRKNEDTKYLYKYYQKNVFISYVEIQKRNYDLNVYLDYLKHKLSKIEN